MPLKIQSLYSFFIDARRDVAGCSQGTVRGKKEHKRKGMKVVLNMHFNGRANSFQIGPGGQEFYAAWTGGEIQGDEKRD